ncbi:MAG: nuclear transport factor 2 family protein [Saprospiraceae bacterium]|nr:nuclear transport factor 2 family protein [Saprospiraceae bacterium]
MAFIIRFFSYNMRFFGFIVALIYCPLSFAQSGEPHTLSSSEQTVYLFLQDYYGTMSDRNWNLYRDFFVEKGTLTTVWKSGSDQKPEIHGYTIDEFLAQTKDGPDSQPIFEERMIDADISIQGNLASVYTKYKAKFGTSDKLIEWEGFDLFSLIRYAGEWKIVSITYESGM